MYWPMGAVVAGAVVVAEAVGVVADAVVVVTVGVSCLFIVKKNGKLLISGKKL